MWSGRFAGLCNEQIRKEIVLDLSDISIELENNVPLNKQSLSVIEIIVVGI